MKLRISIIIKYWLVLTGFLTHICGGGQVWAQDVRNVQGGGNSAVNGGNEAPGISVHDPVMIREDSLYYVFATGFGISTWSSTDKKTWHKEPPVFSAAPEWAVRTVPGFKGHIWAPDIHFYKGRYYLYYAVSVFGKNTSCIGLAVNKTLHTRSPDYHWEDLGKVIQSVPGRDNWNAIDPNLIVDEQGRPWLSFGSFWGGIKLVRMDSGLRSVAEPEQWYTLASRPRDFITPDTSAGDAAIEAPFIFRKNNYFYLFVSFDYCCRGEKSTYKIVVGRSERIEGPYLDREGTPMTHGGGSLVLAGDRDWNGVGHNAVLSDKGVDYILFHAYDAHDHGRPRLRIEKIGWNQGWPEIMTGSPD